MSDKKFTPQKLMIALFALVVLPLGSAFFLGPKREFSENENRFLRKLPALVDTTKWRKAQTFASKWAAVNWDGIYGDDRMFMREMERYYTDHFFARDSWIAAKTYAELVAGKRESGSVYIGKDGYLIDKFSGYDAEQLEKNINLLTALAQAVAEKNAQFSVMLVPSAIELLESKLPSFAPHASQQEIIKLVQRQGLDVVDVIGALQNHADEDIYYRTDHHWTSLGAYYAYATWREAGGKTAAPLSEWTKEILSDSFRGTTWKKINFPASPYDAITAYYQHLNRQVSYNGGKYNTSSIYERRFLAGKDQYAVFFNSNQALTVIEGSGKEGKLLIIKDSYANTFCQFAVEDYEEVHMVDPRFFHEDVPAYIEKNDITDVLFLYGIAGFSGDAVIPGV